MNVTGGKKGQDEISVEEDLKHGMGFGTKEKMWKVKEDSNLLES